MAPTVRSSSSGPGGCGVGSGSDGGGGRFRSRYLFDVVSNGYYRHGLFVAQHPKIVITFALLAILWSVSPRTSFYMYYPHSMNSQTEDGIANGSWVDNGESGN